MKQAIIVLVVISLLTGGLASLRSPVFADRKGGDEEENICFRQLPKPIKQALRQLRVRHISEVEREKNEDGDTVYEIELRVGHHEIELTLSPSGKLLEFEVEDEEDEDDEKDAQKKDKKDKE